MCGSLRIGETMVHTKNTTAVLDQNGLIKGRWNGHARDDNIKTWGQEGKDWKKVGIPATTFVEQKHQIKLQEDGMLLGIILLKEKHGRNAGDILIVTREAGSKSVSYTKDGKAGKKLEKQIHHRWPYQIRRKELIKQNIIPANFRLEVT